MLRYNTLKPILWTKDIEGTIAFYQDILHFKLLTYDLTLGWAALSYGNIEIMLSLPNSHFAFTKANFTGSLYFEVSHVDEIWNELKNKIEICYPIEDFEYGMREFAIYDNNGYILQFGTEL